ncbi:uncharacterized protein C8A04DRAFT_39878 [Dichotomopilus funicola]|uniref:Uncharacterized protein n=1 Tax=Dichotomopilus funicola TaxID=1934379 RepID=A0AAN6UWK2_9PEZI|nr:hypothetical protein C8A04DRAFT_39878 [Dichotomopilus funicola]
MSPILLSAALLLQRWTVGPSQRGTANIILTCAATTFLCCWVSVYPNIIAPRDSRWAAFRDKLALACLNLLGPEFLIILAAGQKSSARQSGFHNAGYTDWTMTHAFFTDMGGFRLEAPGLKESIPIDGEQLVYLVQHKFLEYPNVTKGDIEDRDKADMMSRLLTVGQAIWFSLNLLVRGIQGLTVTRIELTTASFVINLIGTAWFWKDKPCGIQTSIILKSPEHIDFIMTNRGTRPFPPYYRTQLDFISRHETEFNIWWQFYNTMARRILGFSPLMRHVHSQPWDRIPGDLFLPMDLDLHLWAVLLIAIFTSVPFMAWNSVFPSSIEQILWRTASVFMIVFNVYAFVSLSPAKMAIMPIKRPFEKSLLEKKYDQLAANKRFAQRLDPVLNQVFEPQEVIVGQEKHQQGIIVVEARPHRSSPKEVMKTVYRKLYYFAENKDPRLAVNRLWVACLGILCLAYVVVRGYIFAEDLAGLRSLPSNAYDMPDWLAIIPHL